jgi:hypothetical protein
MLLFPLSVQAADLTGQWNMILWDGSIYARLELSQSNDQITGTAVYQKGSARVKGRVSGSEAVLDVVFDNVEVLTQWNDRKVAEQLVGTFATWRLKAVNAGEWRGPFQQTYVATDGAGRVTASYNGTTPGVERYVSPSTRILRRTGSVTKPPIVSEGIMIEAENEMESSIRPLSERPAPNTKEINPAWRPPYSGTGVWYLAVGGEFLRYRFDVKKAGTYQVWVRDYVDRFQPKGVRKIIVEFDGRHYGVFPEVDLSPTGDKGAFGWHRIGSGVSLTAGTHTMKISKEATTAGAAILDAFYLTTDPNDRPAEK